MVVIEGGVGFWRGFVLTLSFFGVGFSWSCVFFFGGGPSTATDMVLSTHSSASLVVGGGWRWDGGAGYAPFLHSVLVADMCLAHPSPI